MRYFKIVADEGHITRAAEKIGIQQPPLSLQIKALEEELGVKLFQRLPRGVELTKSGEVFYSEISKILNDVEKAILTTQRVERGDQGEIFVGFTSSVISHASTKLAIHNYRNQYTSVSLSLKENGSEKLIKDIAEHKLDIAFVRTNGVQNNNVKIHHLCEEELKLALPLGHRLLKDDNDFVNIKDLKDEPFILYRRSSWPGIYDRLISVLDNNGISPNIIQEAPQVGSALNLVAAGMGISVVPNSLCVSHTENVRYRSIKCKQTLSASILLACRKSDGSQAVKNFIQTARNTFAENKE
ncbi:MAG: LysR family transcriptional regulator [Rhizobiales bacterium]|nr:LysR family transcriptional regulator [Hyphomicrobiales bacterium]